MGPPAATPPGDSSDVAHWQARYLLISNTPGNAWAGQPLGSRRPPRFYPPGAESLAGVEPGADASGGFARNSTVRPVLTTKRRVSFRESGGRFR